MVNGKLFSTIAVLRDIGKCPVVSGTKHHETLLYLDGNHVLLWEGQKARRMNLFHKTDQNVVAIKEEVACVLFLLSVLVVTFDFMS